MPYTRMHSFFVHYPMLSVTNVLPQIVIGFHRQIKKEKRIGKKLFFRAFGHFPYFDGRKNSNNGNHNCIHQQRSNCL